jgi:hypothetical protein
VTRRPWPLLAAVAAVAAVAELLAYESAAGLVAALFGVAVAALLVLAVLPRVDPAAHPVLAVSFGLTALVTCVAFWSALPFAFAAGALAASGRPSAPGAVLGAIGAAAAFAFCIMA